MVDMKKVYDDLIIINLYLERKSLNMHKKQNVKYFFFLFQSTLWPVIMQQMFVKGDAHNQVQVITNAISINMTFIKGFSIIGFSITRFSIMLYFYLQSEQGSPSMRYLCWSPYRGSYLTEKNKTRKKTQPRKRKEKTIIAFFLKLFFMSINFCNFRRISIQKSFPELGWNL